MEQSPSKPVRFLPQGQADQPLPTVQAEESLKSIILTTPCESCFLHPIELVRLLIARLVALSLRAAAVTGVDVDAGLIQRATSHLSFCHSRTRADSVLREPTTIDYFPISAILDHGHRAPPSADSGRDQDHPTGGDAADAAAALAFPANVRFVCEDWVLTPPAARRFDVILALSVVKWIHLQHLDAGLLSFFRKCGRSLRTGGHLVLELQPWPSYQRAVKPAKSPQLAPNLARLRFRPIDFERLLAGESFALVSASDALPRRIEIYRKS